MDVRKRGREADRRPAGLVLRSLGGDVRAVARRLGLGWQALAIAAERSRRHGSDLAGEVVASRLVGEADLHAAMAAELGLAFLAAIPPEAVLVSEHLDSQLVRPVLVALRGPAHAGLVAIVPDLAGLGRLKQQLARNPGLSARLVVTTPTALRAAVWQAGAARRIAAVRTGLLESQPDSSARMVLTGLQGLAVAAILAMLAVGIILLPGPALFALHLVLSAFFTGQNLLRLLAIRHLGRAASPLDLEARNDWPVCSVLVALYREAAIVDQLVDRLLALEWPASRLDIKLVCEADDEATLAALAALDLPPHVEIVTVPPGKPRTKPRALDYALAGARGDYVAVYDAEDRPHPAQLCEAVNAFERLPGHVACLQAPLVIANASRGWLTDLFAHEYAGLFRCLLPYLAASGMPLPLGGTSNHFRKAALLDCGGWDPFNVTEDADLGLRLFRRGYRTATLSLPTFEDAPVTCATWLGQRSRWYKGWLQTWLVAMRKPSVLAAEMGWRGLAGFHLVMTGLIVSALLHPLVVLVPAQMAAWACGLLQPGWADWALTGLDLVNLAASQALFLSAGRRVMRPVERQGAGRHGHRLPLYWLLGTIAAWTAVRDLVTDPFYWKKTDHTPSA